ncbi:hypothetical protein DPEC_G00157000 [Dallia pectoralis]|uniref:Uncharacterized protein n=1 Tax=Dallia pectoralis TaxID=75939 RepID=A0ACC2GKX0_DALPE|nr:hypothetical protein DPEC_G00157000 [Dallia pectoralis]
MGLFPSWLFMAKEPWVDEEFLGGLPPSPEDIDNWPLPEPANDPALPPEPPEDPPLLPEPAEDLSPPLPPESASAA